MERQIIDNEIINALIGKIHLCEEFDEWGAEISLTQLNEILNLIIRKQSEIEQLEIENQSLRMATNSYKLHYNEAKAEAVKEFAERLKEKKFELNDQNEDIFYAVEVSDIDNLVKELEGETK